MTTKSLIEKLEALKKGDEIGVYTIVVNKCIALIQQPLTDAAQGDVVERALHYAREIAPTPAAVELYDKAIAAMNMGAAESHNEKHHPFGHLFNPDGSVK